MSMLFCSAVNVLQLEPKIFSSRSFGVERERVLKESSFGKYALKRNIMLEIVKNNEEKLAHDIYLRCQCSILPSYWSHHPLPH